MGRHRHHTSSQSDSEEDSNNNKREIHYRERRHHRQTHNNSSQPKEEMQVQTQTSKNRPESSKSRNHRKTTGSGSKRNVKKEARESRRAIRESKKSERNEREQSRKEDREAREARKAERRARKAEREAIKAEKKSKNESRTRETESQEKKRKSTNENNKLKFNLGTEIEKALDFPVCIKITHAGFWMTNSNGMHYATNDDTCDRNSVMLSKDCLLYVYKLALRHLLLSMKAISPDDIDQANLVPHIKVRKNKDDPFSNHAIIQNKRYIICEEQVSAKNDFMIVEVDSKKDLHCTMIYCKGLGRRVDLMDCFKKVLQLLNTYPELIDKYVNLEYFGAHCHDFWYEDSKENYPHNVEAPAGYASQRTIDNYDQIKVSAAGSILRA